MITINIPLSIGRDDNVMSVLGERCRVAKAIMREVGEVGDWRIHLPSDSQEFALVIRFELAPERHVTDAIDAMRRVCVALRQPCCRFSYGEEGFIVCLEEKMVSIPAYGVIQWEPQS